MIELVSVHEPKTKIVFGMTYDYSYGGCPIKINNPMIDTDFENQKRQGKRGLSKFEQVVRKHQTPQPPPPKPHWFERFLRWWYSI